MLAVLATLARTSSSGLHVTLDDGSALLVLATLARTICLVALLLPYNLTCRRAVCQLFEKEFDDDQATRRS